MTTLRLDLAYDGSGFRGYARQNGLRTIQGVLETALETIIGHQVDTAVAGRTDAGVHAAGQVVSVHLGDEIVVDARRFARSINGLVGPEISVLRVSEVNEGFNARFSATWRRYRYSIGTGPAPDPLTRGSVWHVGAGLDLDAMSEAATEYLGEHDFSAFCRSVAGSSNVRRVDEARWEITGALAHFWIKANAFCHQMVRSLAGLAYDVGRGFTDPGSVKEIIAAGDRGRVVTVAPPHGLTLWDVGY